VPQGLVRLEDRGTYESPDISLLVQEAINDSQCDDDGNVVALSFDTNLAGAGIASGSRCSSMRP
jgi:hypothetical protein